LSVVVVDRLLQEITLMAAAAGDQLALAVAQHSQHVPVVAEH
jgi:hypothetical protein